MSEFLSHECGIALVRLKHPLTYYQKKYGTPLWGFYQLFLLMEKQHNRGQDGAGVACVKFDRPAGEPYMFRERNVETNPLDKIFQALVARFNQLVAEGEVRPDAVETVKRNFDFGGELYLGHLRYGTSGGYNLSACHPYFRRSSWPTRNLLLAGNFNMTNTAALNASLTATGQHPIFATDSQALLEMIGHGLDEQHEEIYRALKAKGLTGPEISRRISDEMDPAQVLREVSADWDGGYALVGALGNGDAFVTRDPSGIRPCHWFENDEVVAFASERAPLCTVFGLDPSAVHELDPGSVVVIKKDGSVRSERVKAALPRASCSFERIYFSRGNDAEIYRERKSLGAGLADSILRSIDSDYENTIFSFIPNTAEVAYLGLMSELRTRRRAAVKKSLLDAAAAGKLDEALLDDVILRNWPRGEKLVTKDAKIRTFIGQEKWRNNLASHVYDVTYGVVKPSDNLVCVDDSIVRGTTLRRSILRILSRLRPRKIVIASTAPQIRYPDCYGIDMSEIGKFIAFEAAVALLKESGRSSLLEEVYHLCRSELERPDGPAVNHVRKIYEPFTAEEIARRITAFVAPRREEWPGEVEIIFQSIEHLHEALPGHSGDWYFTGKYPTPGGYRVANQAYVNYYEKAEGRAY
ncbi:MAG TPA: amidophosphoribosyltransferase [Candidatus Didemnitutus sp.]|nr:amidophosphoribosyltransferase [Candidatus Didemnitutus sp.]